MLSPDHLTPQTRLFLAMLSHLQQHPPTTSPSQPYTTLPATPPSTPPAFPYINSNFTNTKPTLPSTTDDNDTEDPPPTPTLQIHISAPTTINGSHNRVVLPSPTHLSSIVSVAVKLALQQGEEEGEVKEDEQQISVTVDAGTKIEGNGNVVMFDARKGGNGGGGNINGKEGTGGKKEEDVGRKRRASSEPVDVKRVVKCLKA